MVHEFLPETDMKLTRYLKPNIYIYIYIYIYINKNLPRIARQHCPCSTNGQGQETFTNKPATMTQRAQTTIPPNQQKALVIIIISHTSMLHNWP